MNSRFMFYLCVLSSVALLIVFYSMFRNGYLSWKTDHTFVYLNFRSEIGNRFHNANNNLHNFKSKRPTKVSTNAEQNVKIDKTGFLSDATYTGYGNISQCPPNIYKPKLTKLLETWCRIAERHNISWTLFYGSLLGAIRNNDIVPYDSDVDILVDASDLIKLRGLEHPRNFTAQKDADQTRLVMVPDFSKPVQDRRYITCEGKEVTEMSDECSFTDPMGRLINGPLHIDLYDYHNKGDHIDDPSEETLKRYELQDFYPFKECMFLGIKCKCPQNPRKLLMQYFKTRNLNPIKRCINGIWTNV